MYNSSTAWTAAHQATLSSTISQSCSNSCSLSQWFYPTISSSETPFSFCLQSFSASRSFPVSQLFTSGGQSIGTSTSASVLPTNIQGWFPLGLTGLISLLSRGLWGDLSRTATQKNQFLVLSLLYGPTLTSVHDWLPAKKPDQVCQACKETTLAADLLVPVKPSCGPLTAQEEIWAATSWNILSPSCPPRTFLTS